MSALADRYSFLAKITTANMTRAIPVNPPILIGTPSSENFPEASSCISFKIDSSCSAAMLMFPLACGYGGNQLDLKQNNHTFLDSYN